MKGSKARLKQTQMPGRSPDTAVRARLAMSQPKLRVETSWALAGDNPGAALCRLSKGRPKRGPNFDNPRLQDKTYPLFVWGGGGPDISPDSDRDPDTLQDTSADFQRAYNVTIEDINHLFRGRPMLLDDVQHILRRGRIPDTPRSTGTNGGSHGGQRRCDVAHGLTQYEPRIHKPLADSKGVSQMYEAEFHGSLGVGKQKHVSARPKDWP